MKTISILMYLNWWKKTSSYCFLLLFLVHCTNKNSEEQTKLDALFVSITKSNVNKSLRACVLIPDAGCTGCISTAERFMIDNIDKLPDINFVLTGITSKKLFKGRYGAILQNPKVLADYNNIADAKGLKSIYPKIFYLEKGNIVRIVEASPETKSNFWTELKNYLSK